MHPLLIALLSGVGFVVAYHTYGRWLGRRVFNLAAGNVVPSVERRDDADFVPTKKGVVFGHHFTSIAGTGPIVGPAIAILWGWVPAVLWIVLGSIFVGAVHDFGSLVVSLRNQGRTVGDIAGVVINRRTRVLFLCVLFLCLLIVIAIFGLVIAAVFKAYPQAIFPCAIQIPIAVVIGVWLHRRGVDVLIPSLVALVLMYATTFYGDVGPLHWFNQTLAAWPTWAWVAALLAYGFAASVLPVWSLLQPRDYINSLQLLTALGLMVAGLVVASIGGAPPVEGADRVKLEMVAPAWNLSPPGAPPVWPFLFVTIACGACSGFHCLVSSGTSSKQLASEPDARFVGYGAMLTEGFLAVLVVLACGAGLGLGTDLPSVANPRFENNLGWGGSAPSGIQIVTSAGDGQTLKHVFTPLSGSRAMTMRVTPTTESRSSHEMHGPDAAAAEAALAALGVARNDTGGITAFGETAFLSRYQSWQSADGLSAKVGAFVTGAGNLVAAAGLPRAWATALMAVLVASFAGTTLDTAVRLQRYVVEELLDTIAPAWFGPRSDVGEDQGSCGPTGRSPVSDDRLRPVGPQLPLTPPVAPTRPARLGPYFATLVAVVTGGLLAAIPASGQWTLANVGTGGLILWPLFGASNQLLAGLAFAVILFYLRRRRIVTWFLIPPMLFMLVMPAWAMMSELPGWWKGERYVLAGIGGLCLALETWMVIEAALLYGRVAGVAEGTLERRGFEVVTDANL